MSVVVASWSVFVRAFSNSSAPTIMPAEAIPDRTLAIRR
jgi:hypothetical protein